MEKTLYIQSKTSQIFKQEFEILEQSREILENDYISKEKLIEAYQFLIQAYGKLLRVAVSITRMSDRYQKKLLRANEKIKQQKIELEKTNRKLNQLLKDVRELNATKDKFFSIIAHDLKGAFSVQLSGSKLLSDHIDIMDKEMIKTVSEELKANTKNLFNLLENLLNWSRVQMGRMKYKPRKLLLDDLIKECINLMEGKATEKEIHLYSEIEQNTFVYADQDMVNLVLRNLVSNAIKFTNRGGTISIISKKQGKFVEIAVTDTGVGISKDKIDKLFRIDENYTTRGTEDEKGTGLGLILCKEFVEKNKGKIWVESTLGKGTSVKFTVPAAF